MTQEPLYPEGHPKRIEQDSQRNNSATPSLSKKKKNKNKKNDKTLPASSEPEIENPLIMIMKFLYLMLKLNLVMNTHLMIMKKIMMGFMKTLNQIMIKEPYNDVEIEPPVDLDNPQAKNKRYDKRDFVARKHGK